MGSAPGDQQVGPARVAVPDRRRELGAFLRSRRARLRPADVGLADWGVRRVPGLRREEVAQLANVGLTWYTWLEQGRQARPWASVLTAIADALQLDAHEREHLFTLARDPEDQTRGWEEHSGAPAPAGVGLDKLVQDFEPAPVYAISAQFDVLAHNRAARLLFGNLGPGPCGPANMLHLGFTDPHWRTLIADWESGGRPARRHVPGRDGQSISMTRPGPPCPRGWLSYPPTSPGSGPATTWPVPSAGSSGSATPASGH